MLKPCPIRTNSPERKESASLKQSGVVVEVGLFGQDVATVERIVHTFTVRAEYASHAMEILGISEYGSEL